MLTLTLKNSDDQGTGPTTGLSTTQNRFADRVYVDLNFDVKISNRYLQTSALNPYLCRPFINNGKWCSHWKNKTRFSAGIF